ncbi:hypothetical protein [Nocardioides sp.]|uniref:hypothetical protein n=1 Tax=Nocardioides sp. TaxID=35761 RepID=UPI002C6091E9|nr:hypothetical protein [Nocardioides sp.]HVX55027.1 hypothetical protein [Nocardioides sp.]
MARTLGNLSTHTSPPGPAAPGPAAPAPPSAPPAVRASRPGWRDPRLWLGVAIVAGCVVAGARVLGSADDTVAVWAVRADEGSGAVLTRADLVVHRVRFDSAGDLAGYYRADDALPDRLELVRGVGRGELLPRSAVGTTTAGTVQVPLAVDPAQVPPAVGTGSVVDVYVVGSPADAASDSAGAVSPALDAVTVVAAPHPDQGFGSAQTRRQLTVAVPERQVQAFFGLMAQADDPALTVVLRR